MGAFTLVVYLFHGFVVKGLGYAGYGDLFGDQQWLGLLVTTVGSVGVALLLAYVSSLGAALFSMGAGFAIIPGLNIVSTVEGLKEVPEAIFQLDIPAIMSVMSALVFSVLVGLAATWAKAEVIT